jgi:Rrf2 family transcriptional regulator, iron-sulfur cluster assembly transcription factor
VGIDLGRKGDYALRAMIVLAGQHGEGLVKAREIAVETGVPATYLPQVLAELARAGLVTSVAGPRGGYATARPPAAISLLEVIEAVNGPLRSAVCPLRGGPCTPDEPCALHRAWGSAQEALSDSLASANLGDVLT